MDYALARKKMVEEQLIRRGIKEKKVLEVFSRLERHRFVPEGLRQSAYADFPLAIGEGQTISQPYIVALMTECLALGGSEKVLEIGTGSGYQAAIIAELAGQVYSIERCESLARNTAAVLKELGYSNIKLKTGDGTLGWTEQAPFDRIMITAATPQIPLPLVAQIKENGKIVAPLGADSSQVLTVATKVKNTLEYVQLCPCVFVPLVGKFGTKDA